MGMFLLAGGFFFWYYSIVNSVANMNYTFNSLMMFLALIIAILTMRLLSEDRRAKTDQLILTSPVSIWGVVIGKFLAACTVLFFSLVVTLFYVLIIDTYTSSMYPPHWGVIFSSYIGFLLLGCCYAAIGVFMSSLTESQVSAAVLTFFTIIILQILESFAPNLVVPAYLMFIPRALSWISLNSRYTVFSAGIFSIANVIYYLSFCGIFLFIATRVIDRRRWSEG
jgi:ABC-2 type transport system permease protein